MAFCDDREGEHTTPPKLGVSTQARLTDFAQTSTPSP
jgi:hypothetical protein